MPSHELLARRITSRGFTLIDMAIATAVVALLASLTWPSLADAVHRSHRLEAMASLQRTSLALERWRTDHPAYTSNLGRVDGLGLSAADQATSLESQQGRYRLRIEIDADNAQRGYAIVAEAQGRALSDRNCQSLTLRQLDGVVTTTATPVANAARCWGF